jgi:predicted porin
MKKTVFALAALGALTGLAQAQTAIAVYGLLDNGIEYTSNANAAKKSLTRLQSGGMNTSRFGFRGSEDLGGGLKVVMQLEGGIKLDTGELDSAGLLFGRQANVGLEGDFGRLVLGKSYTTTYDFVIVLDPMGYAPDFSWATSAGATGGRKDGMLTSAANLIKYQRQAGAFKFGASYALGEIPGNNTDSAKYGVAASYAAGPFALVATFDQSNGTVAANGRYDIAKSTHFGATYQFNDNLKLFAAVRDYKKSLASGAQNLISDTYWVGASYLLTPALSLTGVVYSQDVGNLAAGADADPTLYVARLRYALSKRTDLYTSLAYAKAKNGKNVGVSRDDVAYDTTQNALMMGIQHRF